MEVDDAPPDVERSVAICGLRSSSSNLTKSCVLLGAAITQLPIWGMSWLPDEGKY